MGYRQVGKKFQRWWEGEEFTELEREERLAKSYRRHVSKANKAEAYMRAASHRERRSTVAEMEAENPPTKPLKVKGKPQPPKKSFVLRCPARHPVVGMFMPECCEVVECLWMLKENADSTWSWRTWRRRQTDKEVAEVTTHKKWPVVVVHKELVEHPDLVDVLVPLKDIPATAILRVPNDHGSAAAVITAEPGMPVVIEVTSMRLANEEDVDAVTEQGIMDLQVGEVVEDVVQTVFMGDGRMSQVTAVNYPRDGKLEDRHEEEVTGG